MYVKRDVENSKNYSTKLSLAAAAAVIRQHDTRKINEQYTPVLRNTAKTKPYYSRLRDAAKLVRHRPRLPQLVDVAEVRGQPPHCSRRRLNLKGTF
jgi:hypothetical protein